MRRCIAVLEDNEDRIATMQRLLADAFPRFESQICRTAGEQIAWLNERGESAICLCLDHDLEIPADNPQCDPGTGRDVVEFLIRGEPKFPVIVHTTNAHAGTAMMELLNEHRWLVTRVMPYGDLQWIAEAWIPAIRHCVSSTKHRHPWD